MTKLNIGSSTGGGFAFFFFLLVTLFNLLPTPLLTVSYLCGFFKVIEICKLM